MRFTPFVAFFLSFSLSYFVTNTHKIRNFVTPAQRSTHMPALEPHPCSLSLAWGWAGNRLKTSDFSSPYCSWSCFLFSLWSVKALSQMQVVFLPLHYAEPFLSGSFEDALRPLLRAPLNLIDCGNIEFLPLVITLLYSSCVPCPAFRTLYTLFTAWGHMICWWQWRQRSSGVWVGVLLLLHCANSPHPIFSGWTSIRHKMLIVTLRYNTCIQNLLAEI